MHPGDVAARLLLFLAANGTAVLDCFCNHVNGGYQSNGLNGLNFGEITIWLNYCHYPRAYSLLETCENLDALLAVVPAVASLVQPPTDVGQCAGAPAVIRGLTGHTPRDEAFTTEHQCLVADDCIDSCYAQGYVDRWVSRPPIEHLILFSSSKFVLRVITLKQGPWGR
ncbi:uncharacterized protein LOC124616587 [Schistocerca americana]|uniref:uncharacterized protein LOC124616587 n=1 Tax=Schistocerca americana TaxID=7009 RepID=UPI001F4FD6EE|nr:uncharacterized protein LOC124616587 [Schistocerca americana]